MGQIFFEHRNSFIFHMTLVSVQRKFRLMTLPWRPYPMRPSAFKPSVERIPKDLACEVESKRNPSGFLSQQVVIVKRTAISKQQCWLTSRLCTVVMTPVISSYVMESGPGVDFPLHLSMACCSSVHPIISSSALAFSSLDGGGSLSVSKIWL